MAALTMLAASAWLHWAWVSPWQTAATELRVQSKVLQQDRAPKREAAPASSDQSTAAWYATLPGPAQKSERLADLLELALRQGLVGNHTEHRLTADREAGLERLKVVMPVKGSYLQVRRYIAEAMLRDPALSLDALRLRRATADSSEVEAELEWSLHGRQDEGRAS